MKASSLFAAMFAASLCSNAWSAVSAEEAKQLGSNLTLFGAEKGANKDGSIPEYTGGLPTDTNPPGFKPKSGKWANPFAGEKPLYSITGQNMDQYSAKLSEVSKALLKRYPSYRIDVYPSHRTNNLPKYILDATVRNAAGASSDKGGLAIDNYAGGVPFPIPKTGNEVIWNHLTRWTGVAFNMGFWQYYTDSNGKRVMGGAFDGVFNYTANVPGTTAEQIKKNGGWYFEAAYTNVAPPRVQGDGTLIRDNVDPDSSPRKAYQYSSSTRRVRLAPDIAYDTPISSLGGVQVYDEAGVFLGKQDRFDFKLIGKKEMIIPYSNYDVLFNSTEDKLLLQRHVNPDVMRWELHRVWVVEATLKPGLRHIYSKRIFYFDEDWTGGSMSDEYDMAGKLYKGLFGLNAQLYDAQTMTNFASAGYDLSTGNYFVGGLMIEKGYLYMRDTLWPANNFTPDALAKRSKQ